MKGRIITIVLTLMFLLFIPLGIMRYAILVLFGLIILAIPSLFFFFKYMEHKELKTFILPDIWYIKINSKNESLIKKYYDFVYPDSSLKIDGYITNYNKNNLVNDNSILDVELLKQIGGKEITVLQFKKFVYDPLFSN